MQERGGAHVRVVRSTKHMGRAMKEVKFTSYYF